MRGREREIQREQERLRERRGRAGRDVNGGNVPDLLSCGS